MRVFFALISISLLAAYYYFTKDFIPPAGFAVIYAIYEVVSRIRKIEILKIPLLFGLVYISTSTAVSYFKYPDGAFVYLISAGFSLALPALHYRRGYILNIAGVLLLAIAFAFLPDVYPLNQMKLPLVISSILIAITVVLPAISQKFEFLIDHRAFLVFLALLSSIYYTQFRENLYPGIRNFGDWIIVATGIVYFLGKIRFEIDEIETVENGYFDFDSYAERAEKAYIENGDPVPLLSFLSYTMSRSGMGVNEMEKLLSIIVDREKVPRFALGFERQIIKQRKKSKRLKKLNMVKQMFEKTGGLDERR